MGIGAVERGIEAPCLASKLARLVTMKTPLLLVILNGFGATLLTIAAVLNFMSGQAVLGLLFLLMAIGGFALMAYVIRLRRYNRS